MIIFFSTEDIWYIQQMIKLPISQKRNPALIGDISKSE